MPIIKEQTAFDCELSSVKVRAIRRQGDGPTPTGKIGDGAKTYTTEDVSLATGGPGFTDQGAIYKGWSIGAKIMKDLVDDLGGYVNCGSINLIRNRNFSTNGNGWKERNLTTGLLGASIGIGDREEERDPGPSCSQYI